MGNLPELTIFYVSQGYLSYKDNKKIYYCATYIIGQVLPMLNPPESLKNYELKSNEARIIRPKYDHVSGQFLGLVDTLGYLTVRGSEAEYFFDYGFNKENRKVLYSTHKTKVLSTFSSTIFNRRRIQYEADTFSETDFSNLFFFLPATTDRIEDIDRYLNSVNLPPIDTEF